MAMAMSCARKPKPCLQNRGMQHAPVELYIVVPQIAVDDT
jgi:hypothetical protein